MTPYRDRRQAGHYDPEGKPPESIHSFHVEGLRTGTSANAASTVEITTNTSSDVPAAAEDFSTFTKAELLTLAKERGLSPANAAMSKAELRLALEANQ